MDGRKAGAQYFDDHCRGKAYRRRQRTGGADPSEPREVTTELYDACWADLVKAGREHTWQGAAALKAAQLLDAAEDGEPGLAGCYRALRELMSAAFAGPKPGGKLYLMRNPERKRSKS
jgi:hypothetical protein